MKYKMWDMDVREYCLQKAKKLPGIYQQAFSNVFVNWYNRICNKPEKRMEKKETIIHGVIDYLEYIMKNDYYTRHFAFSFYPKEVECQTFNLLAKCKRWIDECFKESI